MSKHLYWLDEASWFAFDPLLPRCRRGAHRVADRRVISGIMHMLKTGARWRDCPTEYGPHTTIYNRFNRWSQQGVWEDSFYALTASIDSMHVKAHRLLADRAYDAQSLREWLAEHGCEPVIPPNPTRKNPHAYDPSRI